MEEIFELPPDEYLQARWDRLDDGVKTLLNLYRDATARNYLIALWSRQYYDRKVSNLAAKIKGTS